MRISPVFKRIFVTVSVMLVLAISYFFAIKSADKRRLSESFEPRPRQQNLSPKKLASRFDRNARFFLHIPLVTGDTALAYCDTGGGLSMILPNTVERYELGNYLSYGLLRGLMPLQFGLADHLITDSDLADFDVLRHFSVRTPFQAVSKPFFVVPPNDGEVKKKQEVMPEVELFLGQNFFMGRSWTFDYPSNEVWVHTPLPSSLQSEGNVLPLGFKKNPHGQPIYAHPSMPIVVDGTTIDVLFDTGASFVLSDSTKRALGESENTLAGSFIAASVFEQWQQNHPEWPVYRNMDGNADVIEVPEVVIAGQTVGPVLFSKRPDRVWSEWMIHSMDKVVQGALGGSALQYFRVTIDYSTELIRFERMTN